MKSHFRLYHAFITAFILMLSLAACNPATQLKATEKAAGPSLYDRLGGVYAIATVVIET